MQDKNVKGTVKKDVPYKEKLTTCQSSFTIRGQESLLLTDPLKTFEEGNTAMALWVQKQNG